VSERSKLLRALAGEAIEPPPIWIMRQAGRYLPEYRETRKQAGSFLELCLTPELAAEVTLQPIRRFDFDAAILFSDILVVPHVLGQAVTYEDGRGPILAPLADDLGTLDLGGIDAKLAPIYETVRKVRGTLAPDKALIGFCGAPWTVATYMIAGEGTPSQLEARRLGLENPERVQRLIDVLVEASVSYLLKQVEAGADVLKIFDSWAGTLDEDGFERWSIGPTKSIVDRLRSAGVKAPIIGFPRGAGARLANYADRTGVDAVAVDWMTPMALARELVPAPTALQGNLDPLRLVAGGKALDDGIDAILSAMRGRAHIFNLGHGITPDTPVAHVERLVQRVRGGIA
jgi:uroporphyrinogen decarboxylase